MEEQHPRTSTPATSPNPLMTAVIASIIFGGLAGGIVGFTVLGTQGGQRLLNSVQSSTTSLTVKEESETVKVVKKATPAVVSIIAKKDLSSALQEPFSPFDDFFGFRQAPQPQGEQEVSRGTGFLVKSDGLIVTNKHVVSIEDAEYTVVLDDGRTFDAKVLARDPSNDIALLDIEGTDFTTLPLGDSDAVEIGQTVLAIGDPLRYKNTVTKGIISGTSRTIRASDSAGGMTETLEDVFQTDAAINPGNSGGPLIDLGGSVVAVNTAVNLEGQLIGFAIPINAVKRGIDSYTKSGKIVRPYLGVRYVEVTETMADQNKLPVKRGALLSKGRRADDLAVVPGSPADKAGLVENDIITKINGTNINDDHSLTGLLARSNPGDEVTLEVYTKGEKKEVKVTLGERE